MSSPATSGWHSIGMEWKEHVAWLVPISITMAAAVFARHGRNLKMQPELRIAVLAFVWISLFAAGIAGFFGAMINKNAPVEGGATHSHRAGRKVMSAVNASTTANPRDFPNGGGAAAVLAAGIGSFLVAVFALLADKSATIKSLMIFYKPTGPLSGVTTCAIIVWLVAWLILHRRWQNRMVAMGRVRAAALILLILGVLLTFPPIADLF